MCKRFFSSRFTLTPGRYSVEMKTYALLHFFDLPGNTTYLFFSSDISSSKVFSMALYALQSSPELLLHAIFSMMGTLMSLFEEIWVAQISKNWQKYTFIQHQIHLDILILTSINLNWCIKVVLRYFQSFTVA